MQPSITELPYIPKQVNPAHLTADGFLVDEATRKYLLDPNNLPVQQGKIKRTALKTNYSLARLDNGDIYAIYKGAKHGYQLGAGSFGNVKLAQNLKTGEWVPLKIMTSEQHYRQELTQLTKADQLIGHYQYTTHNRRKTLSERSVTRYAIVMHMAQGETLHDFAQSDRNSNLSPARAIRIGINLCRTFSEAQATQGLIHRDIKPANIIIDNEDNIKIIDYGFALFMRKHQTELTRKRCGTPGYIAPESLQYGIFSAKSDVYAIGKTLENILFGIYECFSKDWQPMLDEYGYQLVNQRKHIGHQINQTAKIQIGNLIALMTHENPAERPTLEDAIKRLTSILNYHLDIHTRAMTVGIFDMAEYKKKSLNERIHCLDALKKFDKVIIIDSHQDQTKDKRSDYKNFHAMLQGNGIHATTHIYSGGSLEALLAAIPSNENRREAKSTLCCYAHVTSSGLSSPIPGVNTLQIKSGPHDYTHEINQFKYTEAMYQQIILALTDDKNRYQQCNLADKAERILAIEHAISAINTLYANKSLNYGNVKYELDKMAQRYFDPSAAIHSALTDLSNKETHLAQDLLFASNDNEFRELDKISLPILTSLFQDLPPEDNKSILEKALKLDMNTVVKALAEIGITLPKKSEPIIPPLEAKDIVNTFIALTHKLPKEQVAMINRLCSIINNLEDHHFLTNDALVDKATKVIETAGQRIASLDKLGLSASDKQRLTITCQQAIALVRSKKSPEQPARAEDKGKEDTNGRLRR